TPPAIGALEDTAAIRPRVDGGRGYRIDGERMDHSTFRPITGPDVDPGLREADTTHPQQGQHKNQSFHTCRNSRNRSASCRIIESAPDFAEPEGPTCAQRDEGEHRDAVHSGRRGGWGPRD